MMRRSSNRARGSALRMLIGFRRGNDARPRSRSHPSHNVEIGPGAFDHRHFAFLQVWRSGNTMERVAMASDADVGPYGHGRNENRSQLFEAPRIGRRKLDVPTDSRRSLGLTEVQPRGLFGATHRTG